MGGDEAVGLFKWKYRGVPVNELIAAELMHSIINIREISDSF